MKTLSKYFTRRRLEYTHYISHDKIKYVRTEVILPQGNFHIIKWELLGEEGENLHYYSCNKGWDLDGILDKKNPVPELEKIFMETIGKDLIYF